MNTTKKQKTIVIPNKNAEFKKRHASKMPAVAIVLFLVLCISLFKNISYPLFWADESETAMGTERVLTFGYPKIHDGKNVFYTYMYSPSGINKKDDSFIGGDNWGHYYFGILGYKLAGCFTDIYMKTGIYRATYAMMGLLGILIFCFCSSKLIQNRFTKYLFISIFLFFEIISISLTLHLREVRYYSPTLLLSSVIISSYTLYRFHKKYNNFIFISILAIALWLLLNTFIPLGLICIAAIGTSEFIMTLAAYLKTKNIKKAIMPSLFIAIPICTGCALAYPLIAYCKTFQIAEDVDKFFKYNSTLYFQHLSTIVIYLFSHENLVLAIILKTAIILNLKKASIKNNPLFKFSCFLTLFLIISIFSIPKIPMVPLYTRYFIYLQPLLSLIVLSDFFILVHYYSLKGKTILNPKIAVLTTLFSISAVYVFVENLDSIKGHLYEMTHQVKGPLDYTIPYIVSHYPKPDTLIIAVNYEETSYMYYLKSKVIMGYAANNLQQDSLLKPDIIEFRQLLYSPFIGIFNGFLKKAHYNRVPFPGKDLPINNIPELNVGSSFPLSSHHFKSVIADNDHDKVALLIRTN